MLRYLYFKEAIEIAARAPRIHHQLIPMRIEYETGFPENIVDDLKKIGHDMYKTPSDGGFAALTVIARDRGSLVPMFDLRRGGSTAVF